ncbi:MAG: PEP/pyruvate-binding domain-containing protein [Gammaproteobacteria bacterium]
MPKRSIKKNTILTIVACLFSMLFSFPVEVNANTTTYRQWISEMKERDRGPFSRIRWFCQDGSVLAPEPYACSDHGGGTQHGEWTKQVKTLRSEGYFVATLLADEDPGLMAAPDNAEQFKQLLIERYLNTVDNGWVNRKSRFYRGSMQAEDEVRGARTILQTLVQSKDWLTRGYLTLRTGIHVLPHGIDTPSVLKMRQIAIDLSSADRKFLPLRNKIHISPDASDANSVREFASNLNNKKAQKFLKLADLIDEIYARPALNIPITRLSKRARKMPQMSRSLRDMSARLISSRDPDILFATTANTMMVLRDHLTDVSKAGVRLDVLDTSILLEAEHFDLGRELISDIENASRAKRLDWLKSSLKATYGTGVLSRRQFDAMLSALDKIGEQNSDLVSYREALNYLSRVPGWAGQNLQSQFYESLKKLTEIEPLAEFFIQDQLRGGPLHFFANVLDSLVRDANQLAGVRSNLFGEEAGSGLRSLNPGLARGTLYLGNVNGNVSKFDRDGIYLLPETIADLPPVAGILTSGEGNPLSHVQLLARNLGIPNVSIDHVLIEKLKAHENKKVILAVSQSGTVRLFEDDGSYEGLFESTVSKPAVTIEPDLEKLDLENINFIPLSKLRSTDSGITVGPKAAKLGELYHHFPDAVANGVTIPFSIFAQLLQQPMPGAGKSVFYWMVDQYRFMNEIPVNTPQRNKAEKEFRETLVNWIENANPGRSFKLRLEQQMQEIFGADGEYGVFVRSDTNVEDLAGFTGAGLNLTVPNVVGFENILNAVSRVWASPFSERAFAWRQSRMLQPEHVYPAVLLMRSVPAEKSGVMVTQDIDNGQNGWLSISVNEGIGGAVDGQQAESIKVNTKTSEVKLIAQSNTRFKKVLKNSGGIRNTSVSDSEVILHKEEIQQLIGLYQKLPEKFPDLVDDNGNFKTMDIEFGFVEGRLQLFQIRPFLESIEARESEYLISMDQEMLSRNSVIVNLQEVP